MGRVLGNKKVLGATLVGVALVFGALILNNLRADRGPLTAVVEPVAKINTTLPDRIFIPVNDTNSDGVEDWREEFVVQAPIQLAVTDPLASFTMPTAITDQVEFKSLNPYLKIKLTFSLLNLRKKLLIGRPIKLALLPKIPSILTKVSPLSQLSL